MIDSITTENIKARVLTSQSKVFLVCRISVISLDGKVHLGSVFDLNLHRCSVRIPFAAMHFYSTQPIASSSTTILPSLHYCFVKNKRDAT